MVESIAFLFPVSGARYRVAAEFFPASCKPKTATASKSALRDAKSPTVSRQLFPSLFSTTLSPYLTNRNSTVKVVLRSHPEHRIKLFHALVRLKHFPQQQRPANGSCALLARNARVTTRAQTYRVKWQKLPRFGEKFPRFEFERTFLVSSEDYRRRMRGKRTETGYKRDDRLEDALRADPAVQHGFSMIPNKTVRGRQRNRLKAFLGRSIQVRNKVSGYIHRYKG